MPSVLRTNPPCAALELRSAAELGELPPVDSGVIVASYPLCESPSCTHEATHERRGIMLCSRHAAWVDRCFPTPRDARDEDDCCDAGLEDALDVEDAIDDRQVEMFR